LQKASGIRTTIVNGKVLLRGSEHTGALSRPRDPQTSHRAAPGGSAHARQTVERGGSHTARVRTSHMFAYRTRILVYSADLNRKIH
jgi:hypothetical protein